MKKHVRWSPSKGDGWGSALGARGEDWGVLTVRGNGRLLRCVECRLEMCDTWVALWEKEGYSSEGV